MNRQANILFNIDSSIGDTWLALQEKTAPHSHYQQLLYSLLARNLYTTESLQVLGSQLARIARHAYFVRQMDAVKQISQWMLALPIHKQLKSIAWHYQALCANQQGDFDTARQMLERVAEEATPQYRARALQAIGLTYHARSKVDEAVGYYVAAGKAAIDCDLLTLAGSQAMIAVVRSIHGDHKRALDDLERLFPLVRAIGKHYPAFYYDVLNSLAVELGEVGRLDEAEATCRIVLASPFSTAYPNWTETRDELEAKRTATIPSVVAVSPTPDPVPSPQAQIARQNKPVRASNFLWLANEKSVIQITLAIASAIPLVASIQTVRNGVRFSIQPRGPPPC